MSGVREFRLFGRSELEHVRAKLQRGLATWSAHWFQGGESPVALEMVEQGQVCGNDVKWRALQTPIGRAYVAAETKTASKLLAYWLLGDSQSPVGGTGSDEAWCSAFVAGLLDELVAVIAAVPVSVAATDAVGEGVELPAEILSGSSGALFAVARSGDEQIGFAFPPAYVKHLLKDAPNRVANEHRAITPTVDALVDVPLRLRVGAWMEESLTIDSLHGLAAGDVLVLGRKVSEPWLVYAPNGATIAHCYLGYEGIKQVVKLANASKEPIRHVKQ